MDVFVLIVSRVVPMLFIASLCLVLGRVVFNLLDSRSRALAVCGFALVLLLGVAWIVPGALRLRLLVRAAHAYQQHQWAFVDGALSEVRDRGGHEDPSMTQDWVSAAINLGDYAKAESLILESLHARNGAVAAEPQQVLLLGIARYHEGRLDEALRTIAAVPPSQHTTVFARDYYLGRILARKGDLAGAAAHFAASLAAQPQFYPALYQLVRCEMAAGRSASAAAALDRYAPAMPVERESAGVLRLYVQRGIIPPDREFHVLFIQG